MPIQISRRWRSRSRPRDSSAKSLLLPPNLAAFPQGNVTRTHYAQVVSNLATAGVAVQAWDFLLPFPRTEAEDRAFAAAVGGASNVILGFVVAVGAKG